MATDYTNQRICRIPISKDEDFQKTIPKEGSIYFRNFGKSIIVGNGQTRGGTEFVNKDFVLNAIASANWKAQSEADKIKLDSSVISYGISPQYVNSEFKEAAQIDFYATISIE